MSINFKASALAVPLILVAVGGCANVDVQTGPLNASAPVGSEWAWKYRSYDATPPHRELSPGYLRLKKTSSGYRVKVELPRPSVCFVRDAPAEVKIGEKTTTIIAQGSLDGCEERRYVLANDGSGGTVASRQPASATQPASEWVVETRPRDLTRVNPR